jgi:hypothetical protein
MGNSLGMCWLKVGALPVGEFSDKKSDIFDIHGHFMPIKRPGILTYAFSIDVAQSKIMNLFSANLTANFNSEYY